MDPETLVYAARCTVGVALFLSAGWKATHRLDFRVAYRAAAPRPLGRLAATATYAVVALECAVGVGLLFPNTVGQAAALAALALIAAFTAVLFRTSVSSGCGCWTAQAEIASSAHRRMLLARNGLLGGLALVGALNAGGAPPAALAAALTAGALVAVIVMELPGIVSVATAEGS